MNASNPSASTASTAWGTSLTEVTADHIAVRGYDLTDLVGTVPFPAVVHLLYTGELPDSSTARLVDAVMVASVDHGAGAPSALAARTAVSGGAGLQAAGAAGLLSLGQFHGAAVEAAMVALQSVVDAVATGTAAGAAAEQLVGARRAQGQRVPGFGHRQHRTRDPRLERLFAVARECGVAGEHLAAAQAIDAALGRLVGRPVPVNIDGAMAALLGEVGFPSPLGNALFVVARLAGILAHADEERRTMPPMRTIDPAGATYRGPARRPLPTPAPAGPDTTDSVLLAGSRAPARLPANRIDEERP